MQHYLVEEQDANSLHTSYPHGTVDIPLSTQEYLEDRLSNGFAFVAAYSSGPWKFVFKVASK